LHVINVGYLAYSCEDMQAMEYEVTYV